MNKVKIYILIIATTIISINTYSQIDYSDSWEDFFSYNNVKDFYIDNNKIYAVSDNAIFIYDSNSLEYKKISSVHGLSGETTSSFYYSATTNRIIVGYENGLIEVINPNGSIHVSSDIVRLNITGSKRVNHIIQYNNKLYIATAFAVIEYDIENLVFGDTFYIGNQSTPEYINQLAVFENTIYAATKTGIYSADITNANLIDFNNWQQPQGTFTGDFNAIKTFNDKLFTSKNNILYQITNPSSMQQFQTYTTNIVNINSSDTFLNISLDKTAYVYNEQLLQMDFSQSSTEIDFTLNNSFSLNNTTYLATQKFGILKKTFNQTEFEEIHPEGPLYNDVFAIDVLNNNLWAVYGGQHTSTFNGLGTTKGFSHFNGEKWINTKYQQLPSASMDLLDITIDPNHDNKVYLSAWQGGLIEVVNDEIVFKYTHLNSGLDKRPEDFSNWAAVSSSDFDKQGNLWVANGYVNDRLKKFDTASSWTGYNFTDVITNDNKHGLGDVIVDNNGNKWLEMRQNGVLVLNRDGTKTKALTTVSGNGSLPDNIVYSMAADKNNRIWIGTLKGLVRFDNVSSLFSSNNYDAKPIIIKLDGGTDENQGQVLLGEQPILSIAVDGADNKWFGTQTGGVLSTNPSGQKTLHIFNTDNSPLPSNFINKIKVDDSTGKVYFATTKGIVAFNNNVAPFGTGLDETYAYPNPSTKDNELITIDGRNGTHLPRGTNVKILDSAGYLVYETNVLEGIELKGGKVIWNKKNLAGRKVASGVYIILLTLPDKSETSICKVAIIN